MSSSVGSSKETPRPDENVATSRLAATMSAYRCTDQKPDPSSGNHATGAWSRRRANSSYGTPRTHMSRSVRSTAPIMEDSLAPNELGGNGPKPRVRRLGRMRVLVIRHHDIDSAGFIAEAYEARGAELSVHLFPDDGPLPALDRVDHVVVLGAVSSVNDHDPWITAELAWLRAADQAGVPVLGICFGAQALCAALGGRVEAMERREIGWIMADSPDPDVIPAGPWLEFHNDRCLLPAAATVLARNDVAVQAFRIGRHLAVQFHPEVDGPQLKRWLDAHTDSDATSLGIDPDQFLADTIREEPAARERAGLLVATAVRISGRIP